MQIKYLPSCSITEKAQRNLCLYLESRRYREPYYLRWNQKAARKKYTNQIKLKILFHQFSLKVLFQLCFLSFSFYFLCFSFLIFLRETIPEKNYLMPGVPGFRLVIRLHKFAYSVVWTTNFPRCSLFSQQDPANRLVNYKEMLRSMLSYLLIILYVSTKS